MNRFAHLLDRLAYEPGRTNKLRLMTQYFREVPDPDRGWALAALTGALSFRHAKPALIRELIAARADPVLFALSYDYVGDLSETVALMWPPPRERSIPSPACGGGLGRGNETTGNGLQGEAPPPDALRAPTSPASGRGGKSAESARDESFAEKPSPTLTEVVTTLATLGKSDIPAQLARWLDDLDETGRWALLKLVTGGLRIGVSARLAKTAVAALGGHDVHDIELLWPGLAPPYADLFAWLEGRADKPVNRDPAPFHPVMLAHAIADTDFAGLAPDDFIAEWKWDGIRVQAVSGHDDDGRLRTRLYSRTGEDITAGFPDLVPALRQPGALDGELLVRREGRVQSFNVLQQRLNRKSVTAKLIRDHPVHLRAYDLLHDGDNDLRMLTFAERRARLERFVAQLDDPRIDLSPLIPFATWRDLAAARIDPAAAAAGDDAAAVEGVMLKRRDAPYLPGRPKGLWWKWKRDPHTIDAVLMYAQRGHGKRSSYYSDYTFGVWTADDAGGDDRLVPVGKAYFGFTDEELVQIDRFVRRHTTEKFGPVRHVTHTPDHGLVFEVAFEGLARSARHKSGVAMRFPRISRLRWDKPPRDADRLETLERMLAAEAEIPAPAATGRH
jgi:DNA ligase-1